MKFPNMPQGKDLVGFGENFIAMSILSTGVRVSYDLMKNQKKKYDEFKMLEVRKQNFNIVKVGSQRTIQSLRTPSMLQRRRLFR